MERSLLTVFAILTFSPFASAAPPAEKTQERTDRYGDPLPEGAVARLGTLRFWHGRNIASVAFSPDGKSVATVGGDICLWDVATGKEIRRYSGHQESLRSVDFTPDGKTLIAAHWAAETVYFWDVASGRLLRHVGKLPAGRYAVPVDPVNEVRPLAVSPDGKTLATTEGGLRLWDIATGEGRGELKGKGKSVSLVCSAFSPDAKVLAAGDYDGLIRLWDVATKQPGVILRGHSDSVLCLAFSRDGKTLASAAKDGRIRVWDPLTGKALREFGRLKSPVLSLAFTPDGKSLLAASADWIALWDVATGKEIRRYAGQGGSFNSVALSTDGKLLAAGGSGGKVGLWEVATGKPAHPFDGHHDGVNSLAFSPDGLTLASGADGVRVWSVREFKTIRRLGEGLHVSTLAYSPDATRLLESNWRSTGVWETRTQKELARLPSPDGEFARTALFTADGRSVVVRQNNGRCCVWSISDGKMAREFGDRCGQNESADFCARSPDGSLVAMGGSNATTKLWSIPEGRLVRSVGEKGGSGFSAAFSPDGKIVAVADINVCLYEVATGKELRRLVGHGPWVFGLVFSPDGRMLASAGTDEDIRVWEIMTGKERRRFKGHQPDYFRIRCLAFSPDNRLLASGGEDTTILLWGVTRPTGKAGTPAAGLSDLWATVADDDAGRAYEAMCRLMSSPAQAVPFINDRLSPVAHPDSKKLAQLVKDLDADDFDVREKASRELANYPEVAEPALKAALKSNPSAEARRRAEDLLAKLHKDPTGEALRALRAVEILEHIGTPEGCRLLKSLADGAPEAHLTRDAKASLDRLGRRLKKP